MLGLFRKVNDGFRSLTFLDFVPALGFRLVLAYVFWNAGMRKFVDGSVSEGFVQLIDGMGFPAPVAFAWLAAVTEVGGAVLLLLGLGVRWVAIPLSVVMLVAIFGVHYENGWLAIADRREADISCRLARLNEIVAMYGRPEWLLEKGSLAILNNGVQFGVYYLLMLLSLFFTGGGRYVSIDDWLDEYLG